jgi:hypothetical protein
MRKIFLLLALALCVGANAQTKYSFDMSAMSESDLTITNGSYAGNKITAAAATLAADGETVIPTEMTLQVKDYPITFTYSNSNTSGKDIFTNVCKDKKYLQANGGKTNILFTGLTVGNIIEVEYSSKNSDPEDIAEGGLTGLDADPENTPAPEGKGIVKNKFTATAASASINEIPNGYLLYSITIYPANYDPFADALKVSSRTVIPLTQENINAQNYLEVSTENWSSETTYMEYTGKFYNMSKTDRQLSVLVQGAKKFEMYYNSGEDGRSFTITSGKDNPTTITSVKGIQSSGVFDCDENGTTVMFTGDGSGSIYPIAIVFYDNEPTVTLEIPSCGLATLITDKNLDLANLPAGLKAYIITGYNDAKTALKVTELTSPVPAETGLLFEGKAGDYELPIANTASELDETNKLKGSALKFKDMDKDEKANVTFILNPSNGLFIKCTGGMLPPGKCYVDLDPAEATTASAKGMNIILDTVVTGINEVEAKPVDNVMYNVNGIRVSKPAQHGIYIVNGKKVVK